jgi:hypothetical protein
MIEMDITKYIGIFDYLVMVGRKVAFKLMTHEK